MRCGSSSSGRWLRTHSAAAKARRNNEDAEIVLYEKDTDISYSGCGMPYFVGGLLDSVDELTPRDPAYFKNEYNVDVFTRHEVLKIAPETKTVLVKNLETADVFEDHYDKLVIATGASAAVPPIPGARQPHVFTLRTINDVRRIKAFLDTMQPKTAVIIGSGFIGLEMCENLRELDIAVTIVEKLPQIIPALDDDMAVHVESYLAENDIAVYKSATVESITGTSVLLVGGVNLPLILCSSPRA